jgi:hypothetical protein
MSKLTAMIAQSTKCSNAESMRFAPRHRSALNSHSLDSG